MNRKQAIKQLLDNSFVYRRTNRSDRDYEVTQVKTDDGRHHPYYQKVMAHLRRSLEAMPADMLVSVCNTKNTRGIIKRPLAIVVVQGSPTGVSQKERKIVDLHASTHRWDFSGSYIDAISLTSNGPNEFKNRAGVIVQNFWKEMHTSTCSKAAGGNKTLIHELAHHYLDFCLSMQQKDEFLGSLRRAAAKDKEAIAPELIHYAKGNPSEYYTYLTELLCGGADKFEPQSRKKLFDLTRCPHVLEAVLSFHPTWGDLMAKHNPTFVSRFRKENPELESIIKQIMRLDRKQKAGIARNM